ncbi:MAG TPA: DNA repair protein RecN [Flavisolibacter sp.]|nr:DNA repair protein RecN [Flavisolibacter sp.]
MLSRLSIHNYAIIHNLEVDFSHNLNVITGETGAGKSIIVGALGLILGERAESNILLNKEKKCIVEGYFKTSTADKEISNFITQHDLDFAEEIVVRREVAPNGKSRAFINDTPVNLSQLNQLSKLLVDLHQQFDTMELGEADFQRNVLDALANNFPLLKKYQQLFTELQEYKKEFDQLKSKKVEFEKEFDYNQFQFTELDDAGFAQNELEDLEHELKVLSNAEGIQNALAKTVYELEESDLPVIKQLKQVAGQLQQYGSINEELSALAERLNSSYIELQDIADEAGRLMDTMYHDEGRVDVISERLSLGYKLLKKHGVKTTNELLLIKEELNNKLQAVLNIDDAINSLEKNYLESKNKSTELAAKLSEARMNVVKQLEQQVNKMLVQVGMPNARLKVDIQKLKSLREYGLDEVLFLFDANRSDRFQPLSKVASGGELSRLMLCIKSLVAKSMDLPTLIFDEIDTGISGEAAKQVGVIMKELATARQVICITHQPQIAGKGDKHFFVYKELQNNAIRTGVRLLGTNDRIVAIAKMLSGEQPTAAAMENAREMILN